jgi:type III secretory pathway lipoprotein EscJ
MEDLVTVITFTFPNEMAIIKGRLESEGIECFVRDELTTQVISMYSIALGGIKLQVKESDVERAVAILKEGGYLKNEDAKPSKLLSIINIATSKIPIIKNLRIEIKLVIFLVLIASMIVGLFFITTIPGLFSNQ